MSEEFKDRLKKWRGERLQKQAAADLGISMRTYQNWEEGVNLPNDLAMVEIERRMASDTNKCK